MGGFNMCMVRISTRTSFLQYSHCDRGVNIIVVYLFTVTLNGQIAWVARYCAENKEDSFFCEWVGWNLRVQWFKTLYVSWFSLFLFKSFASHMLMDIAPFVARVHVRWQPFLLLSCLCSWCCLSWSWPAKPDCPMCNHSTTEWQLPIRRSWSSLRIQSLCTYSFADP